MAQQGNLFETLPVSVRRELRKQENPAWVRPMLATLVDDSFSRERWLFEPKFDGERRLAISSGAEAALMSRHQKRLNEKCPELVDAFAAERLDSFVVDGEIVTFEVRHDHWRRWKPGGPSSGFSPRRIL
jgi:bifunctional non-homologous end joining protein LigD